MKNVSLLFLALSVALVTSCNGNSSSSMPSNSVNLSESTTGFNSIADIKASSSGLTVEQGENQKLSPQQMTFPPIVPALLPQPCTNHLSSPAGSHGYITTQQDSSIRSIPWGFFMLNQYRGLYTYYQTRITIENKLYEQKNQTYAPHGTINKDYLKPGNIVYIQGMASGPNAQTYIQLACRVMY